MKGRSLLFVLLAANNAATIPKSPQQGYSLPTFSWGNDNIRGVNIGGWLVLEPWITPSIFENVDQSLNIVDEFTLCEKLPVQAPRILRQQWNSWTNFEDFQKIASSGFNVVRIPIGYWAYDNSGSPYVSGADAYLRAAIDWARETTPSLKVIIDLHGAPGSQNGYDNSGQRSSNPTWLTDGGLNGYTAQQTLSVLDTISQNWRLNRGDLTNFYREGFERVRDVSDSPVVVLQDAFAAPASWNGVLTPQDGGAQGVAVDHHYYQIFSPQEEALTPQQHLQTVCSTASSYWGADKWTFIGEWTGAMTDCAPYLNGYGVGVRYDGTWPSATTPSNGPYGSCANKNDVSLWDGTMKTNMRMYIEAQMEAFEKNTQGWFWWNFKTEGAHEWDAFALLDAGIFPQPLTDRQYPPACWSYS